MAKIHLKFLDVDNSSDSIEIELYRQKEICLKIMVCNESSGVIYLDKSTAIKFAKTLRTEINKIQE